MKIFTSLVALLGGSTYLNVPRQPQEPTTEVITSATEVVGVGEPVKTEVTTGGIVSVSYIFTSVVTITIPVLTVTVYDPPAASTTPAEFVCSAEAEDCQPDEQTLTLDCPDGQPCTSTTVMETYSCGAGQTCTPSVTTATLSCSTGGTCSTAIPIVPIIPIPLPIPAPPPPPPPPEPTVAPEVSPPESTSPETTSTSSSSSTSSASACSLSLSSFDNIALSASVLSWVLQYPFSFDETLPARLTSFNIPSTVPFVEPSVISTSSSTSSTAPPPPTTPTSTQASKTTPLLDPVASASSASSWSQWASSTCQTFTLPKPTGTSVPGLKDNDVMCAIQLRGPKAPDPYDEGELGFVKWPEDTQYYLFSSEDPKTKQDYVEEFCDSIADNSVVLGPDGLQDTRPGVCQSYGSDKCLQENDKQQCLNYALPAPAIHGHGVTFGISWVPYGDCPKKKKGYKITRKECIDRFRNKILDGCRIKKLDGKTDADIPIGQVFHYVGGMYLGDSSRCLLWTVVSVKDAPPNKWY